jgi:predicted transcriptional regulator
MRLLDMLAGKFPPPPPVGVGRVNLIERSRIVRDPIAEALAKVKRPTDADILRAIRDGHTDMHAIAKRVGLALNPTITKIRQLKKLGLVDIDRKRGEVKGQPQTYKIIGKETDK